VRRLWTRIGTVDSDANSTGLKAPLGLSIRCFQRTLYTYRRPLWQAPVVRRCILENRRVRRLWTRIGTVDSDANSTGLKAPLGLSIRCFQRTLYTYRRPLWQAPVVRRCIVENRRVWRLWQFGWRCEFYSIESSIRPINTALSAKLLYI
jgi:hypothetical protein